MTIKRDLNINYGGTAAKLIVMRTNRDTMFGVVHHSRKGVSVDEHLKIGNRWIMIDVYWVRSVK